jgi:hypothetical protein
MPKVLWALAAASLLRALPAGAAEAPSQTGADLNARTRADQAAVYQLTQEAAKLFESQASLQGAARPHKDIYELVLGGESEDKAAAARRLGFALVDLRLDRRDAIGRLQQEQQMWQAILADIQDVIKSFAGQNNLDSPTGRAALTGKLYEYTRATSVETHILYHMKKAVQARLDDIQKNVDLFSTDASDRETPGQALERELKFLQDAASQASSLRDDSVWGTE